ncbi:MAG TPA: glutaredoxin family protein [Bryobacteraceae bacterium]|jgi:glutaredoxin|nr:glutaredoxin family protein [Bryobacteraceae bacterium]
MSSVTVYGADWCPLTRSSLAHLDKLGVAYKYINIDQDAQAAKWVADHNHGKEKKPTIDIDGQVLTTPTDTELDSVLRRKSLLN